MSVCEIWHIPTPISVFAIAHFARYPIKIRPIILQNSLSIFTGFYSDLLFSFIGLRMCEIIIAAVVTLEARGTCILRARFLYLYCRYVPFSSRAWAAPLSFHRGMWSVRLCLLANTRRLGVPQSWPLSKPRACIAPIVFPSIIIVVTVIVDNVFVQYT